eukprot:5474897-Karenia_brevis.AAC.1
MKSVGHRFEYTGVGFVQYRHPESLLRALNYTHSRKFWGEDPAKYGVRQGRSGFLMQEYVRDRVGGQKLRTCVLEPSRR